MCACMQVLVPITFRGPNGPAAGVAAQHSQDFSSWYAHCPGLKVRNAWRLVAFFFFFFFFFKKIFFFSTKNIVGLGVRDRN